MINESVLNALTARLSQGQEPLEWLAENKIDAGDFSNWLRAKTQATAVLAQVADPVSALEASVAAAFQLGFEASKLAASFDGQVLQMLDAALNTASQTTTMGNALAEALNVCITALQNDTDTQVALDQAQAILIAGYEAAYPGEDARAL